MPELVRVDSNRQSFSATPISDDEATAAFRASLNLFKRWGVSDQEASVLLDVPVRTFGRWKSGKIGNISRDQKARLSNLMGIHKALRIIFLDSERAYNWVRKINSTFSGQTALEVMLGGNLTDLMRVRRYLDAERGR